MTRLGYQIPNFTYPDVDPEDIFDTVVGQAQAAEASGFDRVFVMDHFYQLPGLGEPDDYMLECYTLLAALAQHTTKVRLSALVTGNTYRNPAILAKTITTLDHVSHGRATLGIGSGWFELEHDAFGIPFNTFGERFEKLEEALNIILPMLNDHRPTLDGKHYQVTDAINQPKPISRIPIMIGGSGEKKTLRMVAQYADESNLTCSAAEVPQKLDALDRHCDVLGRDRDEIVVTKLMMVITGRTDAEAEAAAELFVTNHGWPKDLVELIRPRLVIGGPDTLTAAVNELMDVGLDGITMNLPANAHDSDLVAFAGEVVGNAMG